MSNYTGSLLGDISGSSYFQTKPFRTQPFFVTFVQAIVALKKLAKITRKIIILSKKGKGKKQEKSLLQQEIDKTNDFRNEAKFGRFSLDIDSQQSIPKMKHQMTLERRNSAILSNKLQEERFAAIRRHQQVHKTKLETQLTNMMESMFELHESTTSVFEDEVGELMNKNQVLSQKKCHSSAVDTAAIIAKEEEQFIAGDYHPGTSIYYGAFCSIQAYHGGYLSYKNPSNIRASGHKVMQTTKLMIQNADDLIDNNVVRYGDAIWLKAGEFTVIGAYYDTKSILSNHDREIRPGLINCRKSNEEKAQQYGRWIILNHENPIDSIGTPVLHCDSIILEQEWYYLSSRTPYINASCAQLHNSQSNLFQPDISCKWRVLLINLPKEFKLNDKSNQKVLNVASVQLSISKKQRWNKAQKILMDGINKATSDDPTSSEEGKFFTKENYEKVNRNECEYQKSLIRKYIEKSNNNWEYHKTPVTALQKIYGKDHNIVQYTKEMKRLQNITNIKLKETDIPQQLSSSPNKEKMTLDQQQEEYWDTAQHLLVNTKLIPKIPNLTRKYHNNFNLKKMNAIVTIQRFLMKYFKFKRNMVCKMQMIDDRLKLHIHRQNNFERKFGTTANEFPHMYRPRKSILDRSSLRYVNLLRSFDRRDIMTAAANAASAAVSTATTPTSGFDSARSRSTSLNDDNDSSEKDNDNITVSTSFSVSNSVNPLSPPPNMKSSFLSLDRTISKRSVGFSLYDPKDFQEQENEDDNELGSIEEEEESGGGSSFSDEKDKKSKSRYLGLPADVCDSPVKAVSLSTGIKFLKIMSNNPKMYNLKVKRKHKSSQSSKSALS